MPGARALAAALLLALPSTLACKAPRTPAGAAPRPNFVVVVVDTLRADHLAFAGMEGQLTPAFDALRGQSIWFRNAYANSSWTLPSMASFFLSQYASEHGVVRGGSRLGEEPSTLAETLRAAGYRTGAWSANILLDAESGFSQGFERYQVVLPPVALSGHGTEMFPNASGALLTRRALRWLRDLAASDPEAPFFAYLHYMEPHTPYRCDSTPECRLGAAYLNGRLVERKWDFEAAERAMIGGLYSAEVRTMDEELGLLLAALRGDGLWDDTWVIVTADHGELLGENGEYLHGGSLDPGAIRVPLLLSGPDRRAATVDVPVSLIDLAPTILELAGVAAPDSFRGRSLVSALSGGALPPTAVVAELFDRGKEPPRHTLAVVDGSQLLLMTPAGALRRFDVERDPQGRRAERVSREELSLLLGELEASLDLEREAPVAEPAISPARLERLRALGYVR